jgi:hypothetical protein
MWKKFGLGLALLFAPTVAGAANMMNIFLQEDNGTNTLQFAGSDFNISGLIFGDFFFNNITGTARPSLSGPGVLEVSLNVTTCAFAPGTPCTGEPGIGVPGVSHTLIVSVTALGETDPLGNVAWISMR